MQPEAVSCTAHMSQYIVKCEAGLTTELWQKTSVKSAQNTLQQQLQISLHDEKLELIRPFCKLANDIVAKRIFEGNYEHLVHA